MNADERPSPPPRGRRSDDHPTAERLSRALEGRYRILGEIALGGMATVYLAEDLKHRRRVALKVLNPDLSSPDRAERFVQEIGIAAGLTHPNILPLYDSGEADGLLFFVMPYVPDGSLRDLLQTKKQLSVEDATRLTSEVAEALSVAHDAGLVHRDIKPANIMLEQGHAVVSDFGIAYVVEGIDAERVTQTGHSVGTPAYMSPEQADGTGTVDGRADLYALACVTYEMLAGEPPFTGWNSQVVLAKHVSATPTSLSVLRPGVPPRIAEAVDKALSKAPADRFQSAAEFAHALRPSTGTSPTPSRAARSKVPGGVVWLTLAFALGAVGWAAWLAATAGGRGADSANIAGTDYQTHLRAPAGLRFTAGLVDGVLSPDGNTVLFVGTDSTGATGLWTHDLTNGDTRRLPDTRGAHAPFWASDGQRMGYVVGEDLWVADLEDFRPERLAAAMSVETRGASWSDSDVILYSPDQRDGVWAWSLADGSAARVTAPDFERGEIGHHWPFALPDGAHFVYYVPSPFEEVEGVYLGSLAGGTPRRLVAASGSAIFAGGYLLFYRDEAVHAVPLDPTSWLPSGAARQVVGDVAAEFTYQAGFSASADRLIFSPAAKNATRLAHVSDEGEVTEYLSEPEHQRNPAVAWESGLVAFERIRGTDGRIAVLERSSGTVRINRREGRRSRYPIWSPSGRQVLYVVEVEGAWSLRLWDLDAPGDPVEWTTVPREIFPSQWSAEHGVLSDQTNEDGDYDIVHIDPREPTRLQTMVGGAGNQLSPAVSPSGSFLAYAANDSEGYHVFVQALPLSQTTCMVSTNGGSQPQWGQSDGILYYLGRQGDLMEARLNGEECERSVRTLVAGLVDNPNLARNHFGVDRPSGFVANILVGQQPEFLGVIHNWRAKLVDPPLPGT